MVQHADLDHSGLQLTTIELGHASDTTLSRASAGEVNIEGNRIYRAGGTDVALADGGTGASLTDPNADRILFWDDSAGALTWLTPGTNLTITTTTIDAAGGGAMAYILLQDQKSSGTAGGTATSGSWATRVLNTEVADTGGDCTLASNQFTLAAGTYRLRGYGVFHYVDACQVRIQNTTDTATLGIGSNEIIAQAPDGQSYSGKSLVECRFTVGASKALELQYRVATTKATNGLGVPTSWGTEVYASVEIWKE